MDMNAFSAFSVEAGAEMIHTHKEQERKSLHEKRVNIFRVNRK